MLSRVCLDSRAAARVPRRPSVVTRRACPAKHVSAVRRKATRTPSHVATAARRPSAPDDRPPALVPALAALAFAATALGDLPLAAPASTEARASPAEPTLSGPGAPSASANASSSPFAEQTRAAPGLSSPSLRRSSQAARQAARETRSAEALLAAAAAKKREAEKEVAKATVTETEARRAERSAQRKLRNAKWFADTTTAASAATGVFVVSVFGSIWRSGGGSILVAGAIRNTLEVKAATKTVYAVRWDDPKHKPQNPDGLPATISLKELKCTPDTLREAIAEANGLACGRVEVAHVAHLDPVTRFLRPLRTKEETRVTPDGAWVLWSRREAKKEGTCDVLSSFDASFDEETPYPFPAMLPYPFEDPRAKRKGSAMGRWG
jgi:hypothetical protein